MASISVHVCRRAAAALVTPRFAPAAGQYRRNVAGRLRKEQSAPPQRPVYPRSISVAAASHSPEGLPFTELVALLEVQYGLAERFVRGSLSELAEILGYHAPTDPIIQFGDASILLEEVGAPPLTPEEFGKFKASRIGPEQGAAEEEVHTDHRDDSIDEPKLSVEQFPAVLLVKSHLPNVVVDRPPRLFRGR